MPNKLKLGPVSESFAKNILTAGDFANGGGWGKVDGVYVYLCTGCHGDGTYGWAIKQIGRSF